MKQHVHARPHQREANSIAIFRSRQGQLSPRLLLAQDTCTADNGSQGRCVPGGNDCKFPSLTAAIPFQSLPDY